MCEHLLKDNDYKTIIVKYFGHDNVRLLTHKMKPISEQVQGFAGDHFKLEITCEVNGEEKHQQFFFKTKPMKTEIQKELVSELNIYAQEIFLYDFLLQEFQKYNFDTSFAAKCYHCVPDESLVLEDITLNGFTVPPLYKFFDLEQCKCCLKSLALLHASGYMYEEVKTKELARTVRLNTEFPDRFGKEILFSTDTKAIGLEWMKKTTESFLGLIDYLPESEEYREEFKNRLGEKEFGKLFSEEHNIRKTIGHGDLWANNMMYRSEDGIAKQCCLIDYQLIRYFYPAFDILLFLYGSTSTEFRKTHMADLFEFYYKTLSDILNEHGFSIEDIHPKKDFEASLEIGEFETMMQGFLTQSYWCYSEDFFTEKINSGTDDIKDIWFGDRLPQLVKGMEADENFRKMMMDCMYDMHNILFKN